MSAGLELLFQARRCCHVMCFAEIGPHNDNRTLSEEQ